jgi:preprotein translocase SecE subunit
VAASEDRARRRQERRAGGANEPRAHERGRPPSEPPRGGSEAPPAAEHSAGGNFVSPSIGELKKVEWPGQTQVVQATTVVLIACIIVGLWLYANDFIWQRVVKDLLL